MIDVQKSPENRGIFLDKVGIRGFQRPIQLQIGAEVCPTVANLNAYVSLKADERAIHMSRLIEILQMWDGTVNNQTILHLLSSMRKRLESDNSYLEIMFPYFMKKSAPVSQKIGFMNYDCIISARLDHERVHFDITVITQITSVCPCSKAISQYGAHNQRGKVKVKINDFDICDLKKVIEIIEESGSSQLYSVLKRKDEKFVTEAAFNSPKFVEDIARDVNINIKNKTNWNISDLSVENYESIHNHNAYSEICR